MMVFIMTKYIDSEYVEIMNTCKRWMFLRSSKAFQEIHGIKWPQHLFSTTFLHLFVCQLLLFVCLLMMNIYKIFQMDVYIIYTVCLLPAFVYLLMINMYSWMFSRSTTAFQQIYTDTSGLFSIGIPQSASSIMSPMSMTPFNFFVKRKDTLFFSTFFVLFFC